VRLHGESDARPARVAKRPHEHGREDGRFDVVAHGVGDRDMQRVALHREVEGVAANVAGGLQPGRERELPALARVGAGQQAMLDLGRERERHRAPAPLEQVGEPAVGDDDVGERMRSERDVSQRLRVGRGGEGELEHADGFAAVGDRRERADAVGVGFELDRLRGQCPAVRSSRQGHALGGFAALSARGRSAAGVPEPDQRLAAEVGDQEGDLARADGGPEALGEDVGGGERRGVLHGRQQLRDIQSPRSVVRHGPSLRLRPAPELARPNAADALRTV
jgi:hypothetical protein